MKIFAERLRALRTEEGLSALELSKKINVAHTSILRWENEDRIPNIEALVEIAKFFKVSTDYLCGLED